MKTIANIMIINSQNVKPEHLVIIVVIITSVFKEENFVSATMSSVQRSCQHWAAKTAAG